MLFALLCYRKHRKLPAPVLVPYITIPRLSLAHYETNRHQPHLVMGRGKY